MTDSPTRRRGRPSRTVLTSTKILREAQRLVESHGENFTMPALARRLGVAVSSLYNHVPSKDEVLAGISDEIVRDIDLTAMEALLERDDQPSPAAWRAATDAWARSYFTAFARQPALVPVLARTPVASAPQTLRMYETVAGAFLAAGWRESETLDLIESIESLLLGSALDAAAPPDIFDPGPRAEQFATMARLHAAREHADGPAAAARALDVGLPRMLEGLEAELERRRNT